MLMKNGSKEEMDGTRPLWKKKIIKIKIKIRVLETSSDIILPRIAVASE